MSESNSSQIPQYKKDLISLCLVNRILTFGTFTLKSGRTSPYFFNAGLFNTSALLRALSSAYAQTLLSFQPSTAPSSPSDPGFDIIFGPAYKGIPLAATVCCSLGSVAPEKYDHVAYSFNRKEAKSHGEGGSIVGAPLRNKRVLIVDDVITAGTAIREAVEIIRREGGNVVGIVVALDRQEKVACEAEKNGGEDDGSQRGSTLEMVKKEFNVPVLAVLTLGGLIEALGKEEKGVGEEELRKMKEYKAKYGA